MFFGKSFGGDIMADGRVWFYAYFQAAVFSHKAKGCFLASGIVSAASAVILGKAAKAVKNRVAYAEAGSVRKFVLLTDFFKLLIWDRISAPQCFSALQKDGGGWLGEP